jgi:hypothetical protein
MDWADAQHNISPTQRAILNVLCRLADEDLWVRKTQEQISRKSTFRSAP